MKKRDKLRELGETTAALICLAISGVVLIYVSFPLFDWLFALVKPKAGFDSDVFGFLAFWGLTLVALVPTIITGYVLNNWFIKMKGEDDADE